MNPLKKYFILLFIFFIFFFILNYKEKVNIKYYYGLLDNQNQSTSSSTSTILVSKNDLVKLNKCKDPQNKVSGNPCYLEFYQAYTIKNGPESAYKHLNELISAEPNLIDACHYISHGIGEGNYIRNKGDLSKSFHFDVYSNFRNIASCGNGYYHGVTIGLTRNIHTDDELFKNLDKFCDLHKELSENIGYESCSHGIGHAVTIYFHHDVEKSVLFCKRLFNDSDSYFGCLAGTMMENTMYLSSLGLLNTSPTNYYSLCKDYKTGSVEKEACILEGGVFLGKDSDFYESSILCNKLSNKIERKACIKSTIIQAIKIGRYLNVVNLCNTKNTDEKIECISFAAKYISRSADLKKEGEYKKIVENVCHSLPLYNYFKCLEIYINSPYSFSSKNDYGVLISFEGILSIYNWYFGD